MAVRQILHHFFTKANAKIVAVLAEIIGEKVGRFYRNPEYGVTLNGVRPYISQSSGTAMSLVRPDPGSLRKPRKVPVSCSSALATATITAAIQVSVRNTG